HYREGQTLFDGLAGESFFAFTLTGLGDPVQVFGGRLTSNYFDVLGVRPIRGRNFLPGEEEGADVALVTENFWQKRLGGEPNVIGRSITLDGTVNKIDSVFTTTLRTLPEDVTRNFRAGFATLFAAVSFVLLIACSNVANLLLVRFSGRRREIALRMAIGASRASIVRLFVFESLLVSVFAGLVGTLLAWQFVPIVPKMAANFLPFDPATRVGLP